MNKKEEKTLKKEYINLVNKVYNLFVLETKEKNFNINQYKWLLDGNPTVEKYLIKINNQKVTMLSKAMNKKEYQKYIKQGKKALNRIKEALLKYKEFDLFVKNLKRVNISDLSVEDFENNMIDIRRKVDEFPFLSLKQMSDVRGIYLKKLSKINRKNK